MHNNTSTKRTTSEHQLPSRHKEETTSLFFAGWLFGPEGPTPREVTSLSMKTVLVPQMRLEKTPRGEAEGRGRLRFAWTSVYILTLKKEFRSSSISHKRTYTSANNSYFACLLLLVILYSSNRWRF